MLTIILSDPFDRSGQYIIVVRIGLQKICVNVLTLNLAELA